MTTVLAANSIALHVLQQAAPILNSGTTAEPASADLLKTANGIAGTPSQGSKSATAAAGKLSIDAASSAGTSNHIIMAGLEPADSWQELIAQVNANDKFSETEKKQWLEKIKLAQESDAQAQAFRASDVYHDIVSGVFHEQMKAHDAQYGETSEARAARLTSMNDFLVEHGFEQWRIGV